MADATYTLDKAPIPAKSSNRTTIIDRIAGLLDQARKEPGESFRLGVTPAQTPDQANQSARHIRKSLAKRGQKDITVTVRNAVIFITAAAPAAARTPSRQGNGSTSTQRKTPSRSKGAASARRAPTGKG